MARYGAYLSPGVVMMPSYVNIGAWVGPGTMVDTWATVGSCAQIGADVHLSGGVGIGGVLEPLQAAPVIVEDGAFIGSRCVVVEGVRVGREAVIGTGVVLTASTPVIDVTGPTPVEHRGEVPARAVVIPGTRSKEFAAGPYGLPCGLIIGYRGRRDRREGSPERPAARPRGLDELMAPSDRRRVARRQVLESPLSATWRPAVRERAVLVGVGPGIAEEDLDELAALADSAGAEPVARVVQSRAEPDPATFIGKGRSTISTPRSTRTGRTRSSSTTS